jgi:hypothetical protein
VRDVGGVRGKVTYEWMEGSFFLIQCVDLEQHGQEIKGIEVIGHERPFGSEPGEDIKSRFYDKVVAESCWTPCTSNATVATSNSYAR